MNLLTQAGTDGVNIGNKFGSRFGQDLGLGSFVSLILSNAVVIAATLLFFILLFGGISIIMGAGQNNPEQAAKGKKAITAAVAGFVIIFAAYWIINLVQMVTNISILSSMF